MEIELQVSGVELELKVRRWSGVLTLLGGALVAAALASELRRPPEERTWHGRVAGLVPYDFRLPSLDRLASAVWDPANPRLFTEPAFGVGWSLNLARLADLARR